AGETIPVRFLLQQAPSDEGELVTRSSASGTGEEASSVVPLGDNLYLHASLEVAPPEPTRAPLTFSSGTLIIIAAYLGANTTATASAVYEVNGSAFTPYNSGPELSVTSGQTYRFVAYSYNSSSPLTHSASETIPLSPANADDGNFLWGMTDASVSAGSSTVSITMKRRLSRASVRITTPSSSYPIIAISGITIGPGHSVDMSLKDGSFTSTASTIPQSVTLLASSTLPSTAVETDNCLVCTNGSTTTTVTIGSITINSKTYTNPTAYFNKQLEPNKSYILRVDIMKGVAWAGSNVYWDGTKLTFKPHGYVGEENNCQGVFFHWGSLVGISPSDATSLTVWNTNTSTGTATYVPSYIDPSTHSWSTVRGGLYTNIPSLSGEPIITNEGPQIDYFEFYTPDYANKKGDICRYLSHIGAVSGNYRLPTAYELQLGMIKGTSVGTVSFTQWTSPPVNGNWARINGDANAWTDLSSTYTDATGRYTGLNTGGNYSCYAIFPTSGRRSSADGSLGNVASIGSYMSGSSYGVVSMYYFRFVYSIYPSTETGDRQMALPVRCVWQE
ncbi:MAG: fimbrillin family protein, partial [Dysgonamonadaceae bacterium]|nr:fimbrillin family protein [Dysgonamonadaceae bacterium]